MSPYLQAACFVAACAVLFQFFRKRRLRRLPLPPSPPADTLVGHLRLAPTSDFHVFFYRLGKAYGDIMHLNVLGRITIVINSVDRAVELLEKRSPNYSDRKLMRVFDLMGWTLALSMLPYGKRFQTHRRMFQQHFKKDVATTYKPLQLREARLLVQHLVKDPEGRENFLNRFSAAIISEIVSGHQVTSDDDPFLKLAEEAGDALVHGGSTGGNLLDFFPFLQYLPPWFPGTYYANFARATFPTVRAMYDFPLREVREQMAKGIAKPSMMLSQLEALDQASHMVDYNEEDIKSVGATAYIAGVETTSSALSIFFLAMVLYPHCQLRAQEELDAVVGTERLPRFDDRASLPYLECLIQETLRWHHPVPTGVPHQGSEDDVYDGMFIPKGSVVIANIRGMTWDDNIYEDPFTFDPTRYMQKPLGRGEPFSGATWGFGRRICPGRHLADASVWIAMATILSTLCISKAKSEDGEEITPEEVFYTSVASRPRPFQCGIRPRSHSAEDLVFQADVENNY
ncbi:cytochrome P450 [Lyophyllum atratum]|nr:cytochrome P450 [Lyophyllum atratum]